MVGSTWCFSGMSCPRGGKVHEYGTKSTGGTSLVKSDGMEVPLSLISCQEASFFFLGPTSDEPRVGSRCSLPPGGREGARRPLSIAHVTSERDMPHLTTYLITDFYSISHHKRQI